MAISPPNIELTHISHIIKNAAGNGPDLFARELYWPFPPGLHAKSVIEPDLGAKEGVAIFVYHS